MATLEIPGRCVSSVTHLIFLQKRGNAMSKLRRKFIAALAVLFCALLALSAAFLIPKNKSVEAYSSEPQATVKELYLDNTINGKVFNRNNLQTLYDKLYSGAKTLQDVENHNITESGDNSIASNNIIVEFGGLKWAAVYLSRATTANYSVGGAPAAGTAGAASGGEVILTLWLANSNQTAQWQEKTSSSTSSPKFPANMYGTSYIRSVVLNNGGEYWKNVNDLYEDPGQDAENNFAKFTMPSYVEGGATKTSTIKDYLVSPRYISWQYQQSAHDNGASTYNFNNDAWGKMTNYFYPGFCYENNDYYASWKDDLLWLPSVAEIGDGGTGSLWKTTTEQLQCQSNKYYWVRSAGTSTDVNVFPMNVEGIGPVANRNVNNKWLIRPALHLNLTKADENAVLFLDNPTNVENVYNGEEQALKDINGKYDWYIENIYVNSSLMTVEYVGNMTDAGKYTVNVTLTGEGKNNYFWRDYNTGTDKRTFTYEITKMPIELHVEDLGGGLPPTATILTTIKQHDIDAGTEPVIEFAYTGGSFTNETDFNKLTRGDYTATARIKNGTGANYELDKSYTLPVKKAAENITVDASALVWRYQNGTGSIQTFNANEKGERRVRYNGETYTITISSQLPEHVRIDRYENNEQSAYSSSAYTTTVYLKPDSEDYSLSTSEFKIEWYIGKGLYDLTKVEWNYKSAFTYDPVLHTVYEVGLNIPDSEAAKGLSYRFAGGSTSSARDADTYTATVEFYGNSNYETPTQGNSDTYIYNGDGDFPWELEWVVNKYTQDFEWVTGPKGLATTNSEGKSFYLPQPVGVDPADLVSVVYYREEEFDTITKKPVSGATPVDPKDMVVPEDKEHMADGDYVAVLVFNGSYGDNYEFGKNSYMQFNTFDKRQIITVAISDTNYVYDGNPHAAFGTAEVDIGGASQSDIANYIEYEYFEVKDGGAKTSLGKNAPVNVGSYIIKIFINAGGDSIFVINGESEFAYTIETLKLKIPTYEEELTYDGTDHDVAKLVEVPEGWENYIEVSIRLGTESISGSTIKTVGKYIVTFKIKAGINSGDIRNVEWNTTKNGEKIADQSVTIEIKQLVLTAQEWNEKKYSSNVEFDVDAEKFVVYKVYDVDGNEVDEDTVYRTKGEMFVVKVFVKEEHGDNVIIDFAKNNVADYYEFWTDGGEDPVQVELPTIGDLFFNGKSQTFVVDYGEFEEYIEIDESLSDLLTQRNVDKYTVYFRIKSGKNAVWASTGDRKKPVSVTFEMKPLVLKDPKVPENQKFTYTGSKISAVLNIDAAILEEFLDIAGDYSAINAGKYDFTLSIKEIFAGNVIWASSLEDIDEPVKSVSWTIEKAKITVKWTDDDVPELDLPEEFKDLDIEYEIRDENGKKVSKDELEPGKKYTITATLSDGSSANYEFVDDSGKALTTSSTDGHGFEIKKNSSSFPWWIIAVVAGLLLAAAAVIVVVIKKRQAADGDDYDDYYDDEYDFDEEIEEDDGDDYDF